MYCIPRMLMRPKQPPAAAAPPPHGTSRARHPRPPPARAQTGEVLAEVRREFRQQQGGPPKDAYAVKYLLSDGRTKLKMLGEMIGMRT
jgi:hypothetical protein